MNIDRTQTRYDSAYNRLSAALAFYRGLSLVLLLLLLIAVTYIIVLHARRGRIATAIRIDGQIACFVPNAPAAEAVRNRLLEQAGGDLPGKAFIEQKWDYVNWPLNEDDEVLDVDKAVKLLAPRVTVKVVAYAIKRDDEILVALPTQKSAETALLLLEQHYADIGRGELVKSEILEDDVHVATAKVHPDQVVTGVQEAAQALWTPNQGVETYTVKAGDTLSSIARKYDMTISKLLQMNPGVTETIHIGQELTVAAPRRPITVVTVKKYAHEEEYEAEPEEIETNTLPAGERQVISATGAPGIKRIVEHITYHNGKEVKRTKEEETIVKEAIPQRIRVGTAQPQDDSTSEAE